MNTKIFSLILGLAAIASFGALYLSTSRSPQSSSSFPIFHSSDLELYSYLAPEELHYRLSLFRDWAVAHEKQYGAAEAVMRFKVWNENYEFVEDHNSRNLSWTVEMNKFADLSSEEFGSLYLGLNAHHYDHAKEAENIEILDESNLAESKDWRTEGAVTKIKDQGSCGGCYTFASAAGLEGLYYKQKKVLKALSPQQILDCSSSYGNQGCNGGLMTYSYQYTQSKGIESNTNYPYKTAAKTCAYSSSKVVFKNGGYKNVDVSYTQLKAAVNLQPVPVGVEADQSGFQLYKTGILSSNCGTTLDHAITVVGYSGTSYWIVKNQWGTSWGDKGYIKIAMGSQNSGKGVCGINSMATYPTV